MCDVFKGEWKLDSSENFEELMKELGVGMILRKVGATTKPNVRFEFVDDQWVMTTTSAIKTHVIKFKLDTEFEEETLDGRKVLVIDPFIFHVLIVQYFNRFDTIKEHCFMR